MARRTIQLESFSLAAGLAEGPTAHAETTPAEKKGSARQVEATRAGDSASLGRVQRCQACLNLVLVRGGSDPPRGAQACHPFLGPLDHSAHN